MLVLIDGMEDGTSWLTPSVTAAGGRNGRCMTLGFGSPCDFRIPAASESATVTLGFALRTAVSGGRLDNNGFLRLRSDNALTDHLLIGTDINGAFFVSRGGTTLGTSASGLFVLGAWHYVEVQATLHDTTGAVTIRVNGSAVLTLTSVDTKNAGTKTTFDTVRLTSVTNVTAGVDFDDFYIMAGAGDSFLGDIAVETLYPNGNGNANQWLGSDGDSVNNYLLVDDPASTALTTMITDYTASSTPGQQDLYVTTDLVRTAGTIVGVCHSAFIAKSDAGAQQVKLVNRRSSDTKSAALDVAVTPAYIGVQYVLTQDPETSAAWTFANVNALQTGVEVA